MSNNDQSWLYTATVLLLVFTVGSCYTSEKVSYSGFAVYRTLPLREKHVDALRALKVQENDGIQFWTEPAGLNTTVDIMVSPDQQDYFIEQIRHLRLPTKKIMHDVGEVIKRTNRMQSKSERMLEDNDNQNVSSLYASAQSYYSRYQNYLAIEKRLNQLNEYPTVSLEVVGRSYEGRNLHLLKLSTDTGAQKPVIFIDAGHHAREWISHATIMFLMESLITNQMPTFRQHGPELDLFNGIDNSNMTDNYHDSSSNSVEVQKSLRILGSLVDKYDFWFLPVVNPDGYEYTHNYDRLWRKTRSRNGWCQGVDPNRNYPFKWRGSGTSSYSCDETYHGPRALSEPETKAVAKIISENSNRIVMYLSLHAYSQVIIFPYGYDRVYPKDYDDLNRVALAGVRAFYSHHGTEYKAGVSSILLYPAAGGSDDYAYDSGIKYSYTIELPDKGNYGFILPPREIIPVGQETIPAIAAMINAM